MPLRHFHHIFCVMGGFHLMACFSPSLYSLLLLLFLFAFFLCPPFILSHLPLPAALLLDLTALVNLMSPLPARLITMRQTDPSAGKCESMRAKEEKKVCKCTILNRKGDRIGKQVKSINRLQKKERKKHTLRLAEVIHRSLH